MRKNGNEFAGMDDDFSDISESSKPEDYHKAKKARKVLTTICEVYEFVLNII
jgi:hypothetical protein